MNGQTLGVLGTLSGLLRTIGVMPPVSHNNPRSGLRNAHCGGCTEVLSYCMSPSEHGA